VVPGNDASRRSHFPDPVGWVRRRMLVSFSEEIPSSRIKSSTGISSHSERERNVCEHMTSNFPSSVRLRSKLKFKRK
jgi:hypothetical protein